MRLPTPTPPAVGPGPGPFACVASAVAAQPALPPLVQPAEPTGRPSSRGRANCVTRRCAKAIRPTARWWCATASSSVRAGTTSCCRAIPRRIRNCWRCATRRAPARDPRPVELRCLFHRDALRDVSGCALLGTHPSRLHRARLRRGARAEAWVLNDAAFRKAACGEEVLRKQLAIPDLARDPCSLPPTTASRLARAAAWRAGASSWPSWLPAARRGSDSGRRCAAPRPCRRPRCAGRGSRSRFSPFFLSAGYREIVGAEVDARGRLVEIDHHELVVHAIAAAAGRLLVERRRDVLVERRGEHRRDVAVRHLQVDAADLLVGDAVDEDAGLLRDLLDRLLDDAGRDRQERERIEQARRGLADVLADRRRAARSTAECGENATFASMFFRPRSVQLGGVGVARTSSSLSK